VDIGRANIENFQSEQPCSGLRTLSLLSAIRKAPSGPFLIFLLRTSAPLRVSALKALSFHPPRLRIQSAVPKNDSTNRAAKAVSTACSAIAWVMHAIHWSRSLMPMV
jgi:hypothetical protein